MKNFKKLIREAYLGNPLNEDVQPLAVEELTDEALVGLLNNLDDDTGKFTRAKSELMKAAGDEVKRRGLKVHYVDNDRYEFMNENKFDDVAMDEYGKPFDELSIAQKQELISYMNRETEKEFETDYTERRKKMSDYMNEELLKEFTVPGGNYRNSYANQLPEEELTSPDEYELFMEMFPRGEASRILMDPSRKKLFDQHLEWTKDTQYNNVFQHMQYHDVEYEGEPYRIHQTQYYNTNYKDFRNPRFTELMISKDGKRMGTYLVDTTEYIKDLKDLEVKDRVMEGTCGYGEDGVLGEEPAGPHLQKEESEGDKEIRALEKEAKKYPKGDSRREVIQKKIGDLKSDKDYALPGSKADKKFSDMSDKEMDDEVRRLLKRNFMNEDEIDEELFTPNEMGAKAVEDEMEESLQETLRKNLKNRLK